MVVGPNAAVIDREHTSFVAYAELANGANVIAVAAMDFQGHSATNPYQINVASNSVAKTLTCDLTGNLTTAAAAGSTQTCAWDAENRLVTMRTLPGGHAQSLEWDPLGRLVKITERSGAATNWVWTAAYNPLNRRLSSTYTPLSINEKPTTINQFYDPQVEFLEIGVSLNGARTWKIHGPDLNGRYGGLIGLGGLEATVRESDNVATGLLNDFFGNGVATIRVGVVTWAPVPVVGYGPVLGYTPPQLSDYHSLAEVTVWRGQRMDPTGLYWRGKRYYDSHVH